MSIIVAIVGMTGSGKSAAADYLVKKGYHFLRFGQIVLDIVKEKKLQPTEENEKKLREGIRKEHGMAAFAILNAPKIDELLKKGNVVVDGLYSWSEYKWLKEKYNNKLKVLAVYASPETRYKRLASRTDIDEKMRHRPSTPEQSKSRDYAEIENIEKAGPIAMADFLVVNEGSMKDLYKQLDNVLSKLKDGK